MTLPVFLNEADERTALPYVVLASEHSPTLGLSGQRLADQVTFTMTCYAATAAQAEALADEVQAIVQATPQLEFRSRTAGADDATGNDISVVTAEALLDPGETLTFATGVTSTPDAAVEQMIALLSASSELGALGAVVLNAADEGTPVPFVVVSGSHDLTSTLFGTVTEDHVTLTVSAWARSAEEAETIATTIEGIIAANAELAVIARQTGFDAGIAMQVATLTVDRWD